MVDEKKISFNPAVELSYLDEKQQQDFLEAMDASQNAPSLSQAIRIKKLAQQGEFDYDAVYNIMNEEKKSELDCTDDEHEDFGVVVQDVYFGTIPYMTERGTFVINGAERVIVSQLHRSPGVFFGQSMHTNGTKLYSARIIPFKGSWIEFATDINNVMYAYIDRKKKLPVTTLLRAIGYEADQQIQFQRQR